MKTSQSRKMRYTSFSVLLLILSIIFTHQTSASNNTSSVSSSTTTPTTTISSTTSSSTISSLLTTTTSQQPTTTTTPTTTPPTTTTTSQTTTTSTTTTPTTTPPTTTPPTTTTTSQTTATSTTTTPTTTPPTTTITTSTTTTPTTTPPTTTPPTTTTTSQTTTTSTTTTPTTTPPTTTSTSTTPTTTTSQTTTPTTIPPPTTPTTKVVSVSDSFEHINVSSTATEGTSTSPPSSSSSSTTTTTTGTTTSNGSALDASQNPCQNGGSPTSDNKCICPKEFYGENCENEAAVYMKISVGLGIVAGIFLLLAFFLGCQWHKRLRDIEYKEMQIKQLDAEKAQYKKQNQALRQRTPSPTRSNYAGSVLIGQDDRRSVYSLSMPNFDIMSGKDDTVVKIEDDEHSGDDEQDSSAKLQPKQAQLDAVSIGSGSVISNAESDRSLLRPSTRQQDKRNSWAGSTHEDEEYDGDPAELRKPRSASHGNVFIDNRGYVKQSDSPPRLSPTHKELSIENIREFDHRNGGYKEQRGKARSLMDLRVVALTGDKNALAVVNGRPQKTRSIENISTGQVHRLAVRSNGVADKPKGKGIWARAQHQKMQDSVIGVPAAFSTSAF